MSAAASRLPTLGIIGRGQAASALVPRWVSVGYSLAFWRSRRDGPIEDAAPADVVILAVSDGSIAAVAQALARRESAGHEVWLHLSGVHPAAILKVDDTHPAHVGGLHPLVALASGADPAGATAGVEGDATSLPIATALAEAVGLTPLTLASQDARALYHGAAVHVAGHATALFAQALAMMAAAGFDIRAAQAALQPLLLSAARNLAALPPAEALTGPTARGDATTVAAHLAALDAHAGLVRVAETYRALSSTALELAADRLTQSQRDALAAALKPSSPL